MARHGKAAHNRKRGVVKRQPDGRVSQVPDDRKEQAGREKAETEHQVMETALAPRIRAGVPKHLARSVGTVEAVLFANGVISRDQYEAACWYLECRAKAYAATDNPHAPKEPRRPGTGDGDPEAHERFCNSVRERWDTILAAVQEAQNQIGNTGNLMGALNGLEAGSIMDHQIPDLKIALNAVQRVRINGRKRAA